MCIDTGPDILDTRVPLIKSPGSPSFLRREEVPTGGFCIIFGVLISLVRKISSIFTVGSFISLEIVTSSISMSLTIGRRAACIISQFNAISSILIFGVCISLSMILSSTSIIKGCISVVILISLISTFVGGGGAAEETGAVFFVVSLYTISSSSSSSSNFRFLCHGGVLLGDLKDFFCDRRGEYLRFRFFLGVSLRLTIFYYYKKNKIIKII